MIIPGTLFEKICCPSCKGEVSSGRENLLCCSGCSKEYPVFNGTPVFLDQRVSYDALYSQIDFRKTPFGYYQEYFAWRMGKILREIVAYLQEGSVLDDGGGYGFLREFLSPEEHEYYNVDCSHEMMKYNTGKLKCVVRGEELPFKDKSFDNVVSADVREHVQDKVQYLKKSIRY